MTTESIYQEVTERIITELENGCPPWIKPWQSGGFPQLPENHVTGHQYSGINVIMMWMADYPTNQFATYVQLKQVGLQVQKGSKGIRILRMEQVKVRDDEDESKDHQFLVPRYHTVFNICQTDFKFEPVPDVLSDEQRFDIARYFVSGLPAKIVHGGDRAYFSPTDDLIAMPVIESFNSVNEYWCTLFHELTHWTGHEARLERLRKNPSKESIAFEELVAELGAAFLCAEFGIPASISHQGSYIQSWLKVLENDHSAVVRAASQSSKAVALLKPLSQP